MLSSRRKKSKRQTTNTVSTGKNVNTFALCITTPDREITMQAVESLEVYSTLGALTVEAGHQALVTTLAPCTARIQKPGAEEHWDLSRGVMTVAGNRTELLVSEAILHPPSEPVP